MLKKAIFTLFFLSQFVTSQNDFGIEFPGYERDQICKDYNFMILQKPKEVRFSIKRDKGVIYFETNDKNWFAGLFRGDKDGMAIDLVDMDRYDCATSHPESSQIRGQLLKPVFSKKLKNTLKKTQQGNFRTLIGRIPTDLLNKELEFNILFLKDNNLCLYYVIYDLESYPWDLLDMGMYLDSLTYSNRPVSQKDEGFILRKKKLKFKVPFEKNKSVYSQEDIKPIYDSLRLTDYNIRTIDIKAYSSVEGSLKRNIELQEARAGSISDALQSFQEPTIETRISSAENWVEFLNDIKGTPYEYLNDFSKQAIKEQLTGELVQKLEPILQGHRLALLELDLERKDKYVSMNPEQLIGSFNSEIKNENIEEAIIIQNSLFERIRDKVVSPDILKKMEVPRQKMFVKIFNKNSAFRFMNDIRQGLIVLNELQQLDKLAPGDPEINYNIVAVMIKLWRYKAIQIEEDRLLKQIQVLKTFGIDDSLIERMTVNFQIVQAENAMRARDYSKKDQAVDFIQRRYGRFPLSDFDYLSLAQFFSYYGNIEMSVKLLEEKAKTIDIDEDLLFYYINLTLTDTQLTQTPDYRTIMLNAFNLNNARYCRLFNTFGSGGVTFQLLEDPYLRNSFCENCQGEN
ncbi:MAG: hypothetical protein KJO00_03660 [Bacteroidia bacterium]|nr:hypothetical protein [Bacteroidia bacterium]